MSDSLRDIIKEIGSKKSLSEDDVYAYEKKVREATLINIGFYPRARLAMCEKYALQPEMFDFLIWSSTKPKIYRSLIHAELEDGSLSMRKVDWGVENGYFRVMNKASDRGIRMVKFYEVLEPVMNLQREFLELLNPMYREKHAKTFYREDPLWVKKNIDRNERLFYENVILAKSNYVIK